MQYNIDFSRYSQANADKYLLVPNQRLARKLISSATQIYFSSHDSRNYKVCEGYDIYSLNDFINKIFDLYLESGPLINNSVKYFLNTWQREILFKNIISDHLEKDDAIKNILTANTVYSKAVQAWSLGVHWNLNWQLYANYLQPEAMLFYHWATEYQKIIDSSGYCDPDQKINILIGLLNTDTRKICNIESLDLFGFDDLSPIYNLLLQALRNNGIKVNILDNDLPGLSCNQNIRVFTARDLDQELEAVANWAHENYLDGIDNIGIIVPNLGQQRQKISKIFSRKFHERDAWNISGGESLSSIPVVKVALILLDLVTSKKINLANLTYLLQSNYYLKPGNIIEANSKVSKSIRELKQLGYKELTFNDVIYFLSKINQDFTDALIAVSKEHLNNKLPSQWALSISQQLNKLGWPGGAGASINSFEFQAIAQWEKCLHDLSVLDPIYGTKELGKIYHELKNLLNNKPFQIETNKNAVDVLGMLEGAGLNYNQLWICNLTSDVWPAVPDPNPFIPLEIQKQHCLPHSTAQREVEYAKKLTKRYLNSAKNPILSYSKFDGERENNLSLLLHDTSASVYQPLTVPKNIAPKPDTNSYFKYTNDTHGPAITSSHIKAGVKALSLQVSCPFKAFAEIRLGADRDYALDIGPASWLRGQVIHDVLQELYKIYNNKSKVIELVEQLDRLAQSGQSCESDGSAKQRNILNQIILDVIYKYKNKYFNIYKLGIISIEQEVIAKVIKQFLDLEVHRADYAISSLEQNCLIKLDNIQFNVRVDRVDKLIKTDNKEQLLIIDYKTNYQNIRDLLGEQLVNPQLPVYMFLDEYKNCEAVIYAELVYHEVLYNGLGSESFINGCMKVELWDDLKTKWYDLLNNAAKDFASGNAVLQPLNGDQTCRTCHLARLCRKDEQCLIN